MFWPNLHRFVPSSAFHQEITGIQGCGLCYHEEVQTTVHCTVIGATFPVTIQDFRHDSWGMMSRGKDLYSEFINYSSDIMKKKEEGV